MSSVNTPFLYAEQLLNLAQAATATTVGGQIERAFVAPGLPVFDCCPQLTVHIPATGVMPTAPAGALAAGHKGTYGMVATVSYIITVVRCTPTGGITKQAKIVDMELSAQQHAQDMWAITDAVRKAQGAGTLFDGACSEIIFEGGTPLDPAGGCVGWVLRYRASIKGIVP